MAERRTRRAHHKVRTGCLTCKIRRKKCDETKPSCQRCTSTGRTCDGYDASPPSFDMEYSVSHGSYDSPSSAVHTVDSYPGGPHQMIRRMDTTYLTRNINTFPPYMLNPDLESHCLSFFRFRTGPEFACNFNSMMWCPYSMHAAITHPVLFSAAVALGAVHRRFNYGISREAFEYCVHAARFYKIALHSLNEFKARLAAESPTGDLQSIDIGDRNIIMTAEMWLGLFQVFQGEQSDAAEHMSRALRHLFSSCLILTHSESQTQPMHISLQTLQNIIAQLKPRVAALLNPSPPSVGYCDEALIRNPRKFQSLEHGRDILYAIVDDVLNLLAAERYTTETQEARCTYLVNELVRWRIAYVETTLLMHRTQRQKRACTLMGMIRTTTHLILHHLKTVNSSSTAKSGDNLLEQETAIDLARLHLVVTNCSNDQSVFNFAEQSLGIRSTVVCQAKEQRLAECTSDDQSSSTWQPDFDVTIRTFGVYGLIERVQTIGSNVLARTVRHMIPPHIKPYSIDMGLLFEDRRILLRYSYPDEQRLATTWTQQWWTF